MNSLFAVLAINSGLRIGQDLGWKESFVVSPYSILHGNAYMTKNNGCMDNDSVELESVKHSSMSMEKEGDNTIFNTFRFHCPFKQYFKYYTNSMYMTSNGSDVHGRPIYRWAADEYFKILEVPLAHAKNNLLLLTSQKKYSMSTALKNLDAERFLDLQSQLITDYTNVLLPNFKISTNTPINFNGLKYTHRVSMHLSDDHIGQKYIHRRYARPVGSQLYAPTDRTPMFFLFNRPFVFAVMEGNVPLMMGYFDGPFPIF